MENLGGMIKIFTLVFSLTLVVAGLALPLRPGLAAKGDPVMEVLSLTEASLAFEQDAKLSIAHQADRPMIPASTMKVLTALAAIQRWGLDYRFATDTFIADGWLWVQGGDPFMVSEELDRLVTGIKGAGLREVKGIGLDDGLFSPTLRIDGRSASDNPYDAPVTALALNFNTLALTKEGGKLLSGEGQTPLTPLGRELGSRLGPGKHRINLKDRATALRYFGEVLTAKLTGAGIGVGGEVRIGQVPAGAGRLYRRENSRTLRQVLEPMLEYSNNFIANYLFVRLGGKEGERGLDMARAQQRAHLWADKSFGWRDYRIEDGAGLSRANRLSARQLLAAIKAFAPYRDLLPAQEGVARAKTGTLTGVSTYAGFVRREGGWEPFSLMINQTVPYNLRLEVAETLARAPDVSRYCPGSKC
jgi:D-alanyl-D-alanine carboxypeptidase/D-alanyl-D-alanine-endopeptidase (penicillin-binding protein 4)